MVLCFWGELYSCTRVGGFTREKEANITFELSMATEEIVSLKVMVDKKKNRVVFAEADKDFVNILFSFLTLPMGTIVRLVRKQSPMGEIGCMNNIYESVENCEEEVLRTEACKTMLLWPRNAAEDQCDKLKLKIDDREPNKYYLCKNPCIRHPSNVHGLELISHYKNARCLCGRGISEGIGFSNAKDEDGEVFVKKTAKFMISDDLRVMPLSTSTSISLMRSSGVDDESTLEERTLNLGVDEVLYLLKCSLISKAPLTDLVFRDSPHKFGIVKLDSGTTIQSRNRRETATERKKVSVKLMTSKSKQKVLYAEVGEDFVDLLFSFLTFPLGCVVELLGGSCSMGCVDNLYQSVQDSNSDRYMKSEERKAMLVSPKLAPHFGYDNQPLHLLEAKHPIYHYGRLFSGGLSLTTDRKAFSTSYTINDVLVLDPKSDGKSGCGFVQEPAMFMVTDDMVVTPFSPMSGFSLLKGLKVPVSDVEEQLLSLGEDQVLTLLKASLISKTALTAAFIQKKPKEEEDEPAPTHVSDLKKPKQDPLFY